MSESRGQRLRHPGTDAHRCRHDRRPCRRIGTRRRRLPGQALRFPRAGGPYPGAGPAVASLLPPTLVHGDVQLDSIHRVATRAGQRLVLRPKEFAVLELLLGAQGTVVSTEKILDRVWDEAANPFTNSVRMTISRLRAKLGDPPLIETVSPVGYRI